MNHKHDTDTSRHITHCLHQAGDGFDPTRRTDTRQQRLNRPSLVPCKQFALHRDPSYDMWAAVPIEGAFPTHRHQQRLPARPSADMKSVDRQPVTPPAAHALRPGPRVRVRIRLATSSAATIAQQITAATSGRCEIMVPACTYEQSAVFSRRRRAHKRPLGSSATDIPTALDLGYLVDPRSITTATAVWRQHRRVYLDHTGHLHDRDDFTATHTAP